jgi:uncharacterized protein (TIGR03067 family)
MQLMKTNVLFILGIFLCIIFVSCKSNNPVNSPIPVKTQLEGTWDGTNMDGIDQTQWTYAITLDSIAIDADAQEKYRGFFTLDTTTLPRHIDITITKSVVGSDVGKKIPAIYNLSGNIVQITANGPGSQRPASMDAAPVLKLTLRL